MTDINQTNTTNKTGFPTSADITTTNGTTNSKHLNTNLGDLTSQINNIRGKYGNVDIVGPNGEIISKASGTPIAAYGIEGASTAQTKTSNNTTSSTPSSQSGQSTEGKEKNRFVDFIKKAGNGFSDVVSAGAKIGGSVINGVADAGKKIANFFKGLFKK